MDNAYSAAENHDLKIRHHSDQARMPVNGEPQANGTTMKASNASTRFKNPKLPTEKQSADLSDTERAAMRDIESKAPLTLPPDLHAALKTLSERLEGYISRRHVVLGGGTVLAMRYRHRISTDIDMFFPIGLSETLASQHGDELWENALKGIIDGEPGDFIGMMGATGRVGTVPFSIFPAAIVHEKGPTQPIIGHHIGAQTTYGIADGKLLGRIADNQQTNTIRDLYDLCVMARLEPGVTNEILHAVSATPAMHTAVIKSLAQTPSDLYRTDPKPVIGATYTIELNDLARQLVPMVARSDARFAPAAMPGANPQSTRGEDRTQ